MCNRKGDTISKPVLKNFTEKPSLPAALDLTAQNPISPPNRITSITQEFPIRKITHRLMRHFTVDVLRANITYLNTEFIQSINVNVYDRKVIYLDFTINEDMKEFDINIVMDMLKKDNRPSRLLNLTTSGCEFLASNHKGNLFGIITREIFRVSNIPRRCPILKNKLYAIVNYTIKDDDFPIVTPLMEWRIKGEFSVDKKPIVHGLVEGRIRKL
ncbi:uncharacterized protein LOC142235783 [Haematobia irritans]|uniref:uncharacterized protein LOC142235783 n=1 Tax=Haematobia irritans TaxID=7368 RepID=UPI003F4FB47F